MVAYAHAGAYPPDDWPNQHNKITPFASIAIYTDQAATTLATLYADRDRNVAAANPVTLDGNGNNPMFFAEPDTYYAARITNGTPGATVKIAVDVDPEDAVDETGLMDLRGSYDASVNTFPATGGSGTAGAVLKGDTWIISVAGTLGGQLVGVGDQLLALVDAPGQTAASWQIIEHNIGYVPADDGRVIHVVDATATAYGFSTAATGLANRAALQAAATVAIAAGLPLYIPAGSYTVQVDAVNTAITLPTALRVFGAGSGKTIITVTPATPTFHHYLFNCTATSGTYTFEGMTLHGPTTYAAPHSDSALGINWVGATSGTMKLRDIVSDGAGWDSLCLVSGKADLYGWDLDISHQEKGLSHFESTDTTSLLCYLRNVNVHDLPKSTSVGLYVHPHINLDVDGFTGKNIGRWCIYQNGSPASANEFTDIRNIRAINAGIAQTTGTGLALINGFYQEGNGFAGTVGSILVREDAIITNGRYKGSAVGGISCLQTTDHKVQISSVVWDDLAAATAVFCQGDDTTWRLSDLTFNFVGGTAVGVSVPTAGDNPSVEIDGVTLAGAASVGISAEVTLAAVRAKNIRSLLTVGKTLNVTGSAGVGYFDLEEFEFGGSTPAHIVFDFHLAAANKITGRNNNFGAAAADFAIYPATQQRLVRRAGIAPTSIASAATIYADATGEQCSHDTFRVTGNTTINTILYALGFYGPIRLVAAAGSAWALGSSGNIVAAPGPRPVNSVVVLMWEPTAAKWLEIGAEPTEVIGIAIGDETTAITTGTAKTTFRMPFAMNLTAVRASLTTASSSGIPTFDINEGGTSILSTKLTIDATEKTSTTAAVPAVISDTALADDAEITIDVDVAGTGAAGAKVWLIGTRA